MLHPSGDTLFELTDALLCTQGKVTDLARLSLEPEHHRGYGSLYDAINHGRIDTVALKARIGEVPVAKLPGPDGRERTSVGGGRVELVALGCRVQSGAGLLPHLCP